MLELELELKWKWQRRQKLWARAPFGYITMMALPLGTNNCFGFGFVFGFRFWFRFSSSSFVFSSRLLSSLVFFCVKRVLTESSARGSCESLATGAKMQLCSGLPANIYRFIAVGYGHQ